MCVFVCLEPLLYQNFHIGKVTDYHEAHAHIAKQQFFAVKFTQVGLATEKYSQLPKAVACSPLFIFIAKTALQDDIVKVL